MEMARLFLAYAVAGAFKAIAVKAAMVLPALLLQKPSAVSKAKEHIQCLVLRSQPAILLCRLGLRKRWSGDYRLLFWYSGPPEVRTVGM